MTVFNAKKLKIYFLPLFLIFFYSFVKWFKATKNRIFMFLIRLVNMGVWWMLSEYFSNRCYRVRLRACQIDHEIQDHDLKHEILYHGMSGYVI